MAVKKGAYAFWFSLLVAATLGEHSQRLSSFTNSRILRDHGKTASLTDTSLLGDFCHGWNEIVIYGMLEGLICTRLED